MPRSLFMFLCLSVIGATCLYTGLARSGGVDWLLTIVGSLVMLQGFSYPYDALKDKRAGRIRTSSPE